MTGITEDNVVSTYRLFAPFYDWVFGPVLQQGRRKMAEEAKQLQPESLLEVGVGTGLALPHYPTSTRITGIDISEAMLKRARAAAKQLTAHQISLAHMDAEKLSFEDDTFDCVTLPYVLSVTPHPDKLNSELRRVCKPGGHIIIVNHFSGQRGWSVLERTLKSLSRLIGFRSEFSFEQHVPHPSWTILKTESTNIFSLSRIVVIKNAAN